MFAAGSIVPPVSCWPPQQLQCMAWPNLAALKWQMPNSLLFPQAAQIVPSFSVRAPDFTVLIVGTEATAHQLLSIVVRLSGSTQVTGPGKTSAVSLRARLAWHRAT